MQTWGLKHLSIQISNHILARWSAGNQNKKTAVVASIYFKKKINNPTMSCKVNAADRCGGNEITHTTQTSWTMVACKINNWGRRWDEEFLVPPGASILVRAPPDPTNARKWTCCTPNHTEKTRFLLHIRDMSPLKKKHNPPSITQPLKIYTARTRRASLGGRRRRRNISSSTWNNSLKRGGGAHKNIISANFMNHGRVNMDHKGQRSGAANFRYPWARAFGLSPPPQTQATTCTKTCYNPKSHATHKGFIS